MSKYEDFGKYLADTYINIFSKPLWVECNEGWFTIIHELSKQVNEAAEKYPRGSISVVQIKEKFGGLRYYLNYENMSDENIQKIEDLVRVAENKSISCCEDCGEPAELCSPRKYWMKTICMKCRDRYDMGDTPNGI